MAENSFQTPNEVNWDSGNIVISQNRLRAHPGFQGSPHPETPARPAETSFVVDTTFQDFDAAIERGSVVEILTELGGTVLRAPAFIGEHGVSGFVTRLQDILQPIFFPLVAKRQGNASVSLKRVRPDPNGNDGIFLDITASTTISRQSSTRRSRWRVQTSVSPSSGPVRTSMLHERKTENQARVITFTQVEAGAVESTTIDACVEVMIPSLQEILPNLLEEVKKMLQEVGLIEPNKDHQSNLTPGTDAHGNPDQGWIDKVNQVLSKIKDAFVAAIERELAVVSVERIVLSFGLVSSAGRIAQLGGLWEKWYRDEMAKTEEPLAPWPTDPGAERPAKQEARPETGGSDSAAPSPETGEVVPPGGTTGAMPLDGTVERLIVSVPVRPLKTASWRVPLKLGNT